MKLIDLTGQRFGKLTVIERSDTIDGVVFWLCRCDCGNKTKVRSQTLRRGQSKSCGCNRFGIRKENDFDLSGDYGICTIKDGVQFIFDKEDYEKIRNYRWYKDKDGYIYTTKNGVNRLHRFLIDCPEGMVIDHINRNPLDNRKVNLRVCTIQENIWNRRFIGYRKMENGKYRVSFRINKVETFRKTYDTEEEAISKRKELELKYRGVFACKE